MTDVLGVIVRWLHISSMAALVGGVLYGRLVVAPVLDALHADSQGELDESIAARYRTIVYAAVAGLLLSGLYNLLITPGHTLRYHILFGVKMLLALHVFATALLMVQPGAGKRTRRMTGVMISGLIIIAIAAYLRRIF